MKVGELYFNDESLYLSTGIIQKGMIFMVMANKGKVKLTTLRGTIVQGDDYVLNSSKFKPISEYGELFKGP